MRNNKGFTILEMLAVIAVIMILASLTIKSYRAVVKKAQIERARADIGRLEAAIQAYMVDFKAYPPGNSNATMVNLLSNDQMYKNNARGAGPYLTFKAGELTGGQFMDPWGRAYYYNQGASHNRPNFVDIYSDGPTTAGPSDDITNWN
jgi:general secretion pathway protein G